ncbi:oleoyl-acyl carrier protein thioesterase 1, chloroplastic-like [Brassica napus]|uniref:oleoyl-acyl carrier protein thioesterase 1, chloroplastic-like n=1 Tax=Brassica napus TaxID=3708 RepID=UPI00207AFA4D|nr:oleoyl-acyl carrier protein thioesterase 1, chloroplastic-like [Brassica napus]
MPRGNYPPNYPIRLEAVTGKVNAMLAGQSYRYIHEMPTTLFYVYLCRLAFPEEENNRSLKKIPILEDPEKYSIIGLKPRRADLDMNHHINNVTYIGWLLEVSVIIRLECQQDDVVDSLTTSKNGFATSGTQSHNDSQFLHLLRFFGDGQEINHGTTLWRKKPSR